MNSEFVEAYGKDWIERFTFEIEEGKDKAKVYIVEQGRDPDEMFTIYKKGNNYYIR